MRSIAPDLAASNLALTRYPGGKNGSGVYHRLINLMPPHRTFIEAFLGSGALIRRKRRASVNVGIDANATVIARHRQSAWSAGVRLVNACAMDWLRQQSWREGTLVYADPPYVGASRHSERACYEFEMMRPERHAALLEILTTIPAMVIVSHYRCALYDQALADWRRIDYLAMTRGGPKPESAWCNFPEPARLHDYRFLGKDFHDRLRIKRKIETWTRRLKGMPALERAAVLDALGAAAAP